MYKIPFFVNNSVNRVLVEAHGFFFGKRAKVNVSIIDIREFLLDRINACTNYHKKSNTEVHIKIFADI